jgi:hypothetical protein
VLIGSGPETDRICGPPRGLKPLLQVALVAFAIVVSACGGGQSADRRPWADGGQPFPRLSRVAVIVLENRSYGQVIGSPNAPYLNGLARRYALATRYYAITHPSLPNYIALTGGSTFEISKDCANCDTPGPNVVGQMDRAGISWKAYFEDIEVNGRPGPLTHHYNPHYNPFVYYESVRSVARDRARVVSFRALYRDLDGRALPRFAWIAPGVHHDGHNSTLLAADRFASDLVPKVLHALGPHGVLYLTWDEGSSSDRRGIGGRPGGGRVALIAAGRAARRHAQHGVPANHYSLLRTIEAGFGLRALGNAGAKSTPLLGGLLSGD